MTVLHRIAVLVGGAGLLAAAFAASAHHSRALHFDIEQEITQEGVVSSWQWRNPHPFIFLDVATASGETETWAVELPNTVAMTRRGWTPETVAVGDHLTITGSPGRDGRRIMTLSSVLRAEDGWEWRGFGFRNND